MGRPRSLSMDARSEALIRGFRMCTRAWLISPRRKRSRSESGARRSATGLVTAPIFGAQPSRLKLTAGLGKSEAGLFLAQPNFRSRAVEVCQYMRSNDDHEFVALRLLGIDRKSTRLNSSHL